MTATWTDVYLSAALCVGVLTIPGALVALAARTRAVLVVTLAVPLSVTIVAATSVVAPRLGLDWGIGTLAVLTLAALGVAAPLGILRTLRQRAASAHVATPGNDDTLHWRGNWWVLPVALLISAAIHLYRLTTAIGHPNAVSQTYDSPFHHNLVARFLENHNASFMNGNLTTYGTQRGFYPALWHQITSLTAQASTTSDTAEAMNATLIAVTAVIWPLSVAMLVGMLLRSWNAAAVGALVAFASFQMPNLFTYFGVLYPNLLAYSIICFYLAAGVNLLFPGNHSQPLWTFILTTVSMLGLAIAHPSGFISFVLLSFPLVVVGAWSVGSRTQLPRGATKRTLAWISVGGVLVLYTALNALTMRVGSLAHMRTNEEYWPPIGSPVVAVIQAFSLKADRSLWEGGIIPSLIGGIVIIGMFYALRSRRTAWLPFAHLIAVGLYLASFSLDGPWRPYIVGLWYSDIRRFAALLGVTAIPLLALGTYGIAHYLWNHLNSRIDNPKLPILTRHRQVCSLTRKQAHTPTADNAPSLRIIAIVSALVFLLGQLSGTVRTSYLEIRSHMAFDTAEQANLGMLSVDEAELMQRMEQHVPQGSEVIGNPWNGSVFAPAFGHVRFTFPHLAPVADPEGAYVARHLNEAPTNPLVCHIIKKRSITHVLDFGQDYLWGGDWNKSHLNSPGIYALEETGTARIVDQEGRAKLMEITACSGH